MPTGRPKMANLPADLMAGLTTALVGIPQAMGFATVAGIYIPAGFLYRL
jgi:MFS superfamily sulfate permease-like transporter